MHSKQGKKNDRSTPSPHTSAQTSPQTHKKTKNHTIRKSLKIKYLLNHVEKSLIFFAKIFGGYKKKL